MYNVFGGFEMDEIAVLIPCYNESKTIECLTLVKGKLNCDRMDVPLGSTILLWPGESLSCSDIELAFVSKIMEDSL